MGRRTTPLTACFPELGFPDLFLVARGVALGRGPWLGPQTAKPAQEAPPPLPKISGWVGSDGAVLASLWPHPKSPWTVEKCSAFTSFESIAFWAFPTVVEGFKAPRSEFLFPLLPPHCKMWYDDEVLTNHWIICFQSVGWREENENRDLLVQHKDSQGAGGQGPSRKPNWAEGDPGAT